MTAPAATCEALLEMEGQMLATRAAWRRGRDPGSLTHLLSLSLPIHDSETAATSKEGSIFKMQGSEGCELLWAAKNMSVSFRVQQNHCYSHLQPNKKQLCKNLKVKKQCNLSLWL